VTALPQDSALGRDMTVREQLTHLGRLQGIGAREIRGEVERILELVDLKDRARATGAEPAEVALAWLIAREGVTAPIASATSLEQLDGLVRATRLALSAQDIASLTAVSG